MLTILSTTVWERRRSTLWWVLGMMALAGLTVAFFPSIRNDAEAYESLFDSMPEGLLSVFGIEDASTLVTAVGLVNSRIYSGIGPVVLAALGIGLGSSAIAGEEERGTLDLLLAQPVTRTQIVLGKFAAAAIIIGVVVLSLFGILAILNPIVDLDFTLTGMVGANVTLGLLALTFCAFATALGAGTGRRGVTTGISAAVTATFFFINGLAPLVEEILWMRRLTPFYWLQHPNPLANGIDPAAIAVFLGAIALCLFVAVWTFNRRDVGV